jgi:hypothetical protein
MNNQHIILVEKPCKITQKKANRETFSVKYSKNKQISTRGTLLKPFFFRIFASDKAPEQ